MFARPDLAADRVSYPVPPFTAIRGLLEAFYWKRAMEWTIDRVWVLSPIQFVQIMRNERMLTGHYTQRRSLFLKHPSYVVSATPRSIKRQQKCTEYAAHNRPPSLLTLRDLPMSDSKYVEMTQTWLKSGRMRQPLSMGVRECIAYMGEPPRAFRAIANETALHHQSLVLGPMPVKIMYNDVGTPVEVDWAEYDYDLHTGSYGVRR